MEYADVRRTLTEAYQIWMPAACQMKEEAFVQQGILNQDQWSVRSCWVWGDGEGWEVGEEGACYVNDSAKLRFNEVV